MDIWQAIEDGDVSTVRQLIESDTSLVHTRMQSGGGDEQPLHYAIWQDQPKIVSLLLRHGAEIEAIGSEWEGRPIKYIGFDGDARPDILRILIDRGVDLNSKDAQELYQHACDIAPHEEEWAEVMNIFVEHGRQVSLADAVALGDIERLQSELEKRPDIGNTELSALLEAAASTTQVEAISLLLERGADPQLSSPFGSLVSRMCTIYCQALGYKHKQQEATNAIAIIRLLVEYGADVNEPHDSAGVPRGENAMVDQFFRADTPLAIAKLNGATELEAVLLKAGAKPSGDEPNEYDPQKFLELWMKNQMFGEMQGQDPNGEAKE